MGKAITLAVAGVVICIALFALVFYFTTSNVEISLRNQVNAQQTNLTVVFDSTWKILQQQADVADQYREAFAKIYPDLMSGRYGDPKKERRVLLNFITESNPSFDTKLYERLSVSIEAQRVNFANEQKKLIDLGREHENLRLLFPTSLVCKSRPKIELKIVTSTKTEKAFETGKEDNTKLFDN